MEFPVIANDYIIIDLEDDLYDTMITTIGNPIYAREERTARRS